MKIFAGPSPPKELAVSRTGSTVDVSVIVPVIERPAPLASLYREYSEPLRREAPAVEFIFVSASWPPAAKEAVLELARTGEPVKLLDLGQNPGEAGLIRAALEYCLGRIVVTLPAYHRIEAGALPALVARVKAGADLVVARRWPRRDSWLNQLQNRVLHRLISGLTNDQVHDVACGVRAMKKDFLFEIAVYGDFFRFLPLLAMREGFAVEEIDAPQHPADRSPRIYSPGVYLRRLLDIFGLFFLLRFTDKPLRFFGLVGSLLSLAGAVILAFGAFERIVAGKGLADRPLLLLAVMLIVLGAQAVALGLIGEIIVHLQSRRAPSYRVADERGPAD